MNSIGLLVDLRKQSVVISVRDGQLSVKAPQGALTTALKAELSAAKSSIIDTFARLGIQSNTQLAQTSFAQQRLWFLDVLEKGSSQHNMPQQLRFDGALSVSALEKTLNHIIERHEVLRTTYISDSGEPFQVIRQFEYQPLNIIDLSDLPADEINSRAASLIASEVATPFNLERDTMLRATLLRLAENDHLLLYTLHHIASDGWSQGILMAEFNALYQSFEAEEPPALAPLPLQYADYAHWQRDWLKGDVLQEKLEYWTNQLTGIPLVHNLPLDRPRPRHQTFNGSQHISLIDSAAISNFKGLLRRQNCTLFMGLHAVLALLLGRLSGENDIVIGTPIANREQQDIAPLIGFFINVLVLRSQLTDVTSFSTLLAQSKEVALGAYAHQQVPFEELIKALNLGKSLSVSPVFQIMLVLQNNVSGTASPAQLKFRQQESEVSQAKFDLSLSAVETEGRLQIIWSYNTDLFNHQTIEMMSSCFTTLLNAVTSHPDVPLQTLPLHNLEFAKNTQEPLSDAICMHQLFEQQARARPNATALCEEGHQLSYYELNRQANQLAHLLIARGVTPQQPVAFYLPRKANMIVAVMAILKAGGCYVAIDNSFPADRAAQMCEEVNAKIILTAGPVEASSALSVLQVINLNDEDVQQRLSFCPQHDPVCRRAPDDLAYLCFTSGSTGKPKAVMVTHCNLYAYFDSVKTHYELTPQDNVLQFSSVSFDIFVEEVFCALSSGATLVLRNDDMLGGGQAFWQFLKKYQITLLTLPTAYWHSLCAGLDEQMPTEMGSLRLLVLGGESMSPEMLSRWQRGTRGDVRVLNTYGPTETTVITCFYDATHFDTARGAVPIGQPIKHVTCHILDEHLQLCPPGIFGELCIAGPGVSRGYFGRQSLTEKAFVEVSHLAPGMVVYRTGDIARYTTGGEIEFKGRMDSQVKIRGFRVELNEIEQRLSRLPYVDASVVLSRQNSSGMNYLIAYVKPALSAEETDTATLVKTLQAACRQRLPDYMVPASFVIVDHWPLTPQGKVDKKALPEPSYDDSQAIYSAPASATEKQLCTIWSQLLDIPEDKLSVTANFFESGGHSLLCVRLVAGIQQVFGYQIDVKAIFENPTLQQMATFLDKLDDPAFAAQALRSDYENQALQKICVSDKALPTVYFVPGVAGSAFMFEQFAQQGAAHFHSLAFNHRGVFGDVQPFQSIEENAAYFVQQIRRYQATGPYYIAGHSYGGAIAYEMARKLEEMGENVQLILLDTYFEQQLLERKPEVTHAANDELPDAQGLPQEQCDFKEKIEALATMQTRMLLEYQPPSTSKILPLVVLAQASPFEPAAYVDYLGEIFTCGIIVHQAQTDHFSMLKAPACQPICKLIADTVLVTERKKHYA